MGIRSSSRIILLLITHHLILNGFERSSKYRGSQLTRFLWPIIERIQKFLASPILLSSPNFLKTRVIWIRVKRGPPVLHAMKLEKPRIMYFYINYSYLPFVIGRCSYHLLFCWWLKKSQFFLNINSGHNFNQNHQCCRDHM